MKKSKILLCTLTALFLFGLFTTTVFAQIIPKYTKLPATDPADDVYYNNTGSQSEFNGTGDYIDWIDVLEVNITGNSINVVFQGAGSRSGGNYHFAIGWDVDGDKVPDIVILYSTAYSGYVLQNQISGHPQFGYCWTGSSWTAVPTSLPYTDSGVTLTLEQVGTGISNLSYTLANLDFRLYVYWTDLFSFSYADFLPEVFGGGIPGFQIYTLLFSLITLISMIAFYRFKRL